MKLNRFNSSYKEKQPVYLKKTSQSTSGFISCSLVLAQSGTLNGFSRKHLAQNNNRSFLQKKHKTNKTLTF